MTSTNVNETLKEDEVENEIDSSMDALGVEENTSGNGDDGTTLRHERVVVSL